MLKRRDVAEGFVLDLPICGQSFPPRDLGTEVVSALLRFLQNRDGFSRWA